MQSDTNAIAKKSAAASFAFQAVKSVVQAQAASAAPGVANSAVAKASAAEKRSAAATNAAQARAQAQAASAALDFVAKIAGTKATVVAKKSADANHASSTSACGFKRASDGLDPDCVCPGETQCVMGKCWFYGGRTQTGRRR
jgi:hypothetical protein